MNILLKKLLLTVVMFWSTLSGASDLLSGSGVFVGVYLADAKYEEGDVLAVGGEREVTLYNYEMPLAGVVSSIDPIMVESDDGAVYYKTYIVLKGRATVKINGSTTIGNFIIADKNGRGRPIEKEDFLLNGYKGNSTNIIGISLEDEIDKVVIKI
jgi:hypothetical protein